MKKLILLSAFVVFALFSFGQRSISDTLQGAETVSFTAMQGAKVVSATCTQLGGTSDGTLALYGSTDNSVWVFLNYLDGHLGVASPKASITGADLNQVTITDGLVASWLPIEDIYSYKKIVGVGTTGDTTLISINWGK